MSTVNISFNDDLLKQIDKVAEEESRTRSELIREAARSYIQRKDRWGQIFQLGSSLAESRKIKAADIEKEIAAYRKSRRA
jgi:CopG family transcriptional regulator/antitoxin EndoAI